MKKNDFYFDVKDLPNILTILKSDDRILFPKMMLPYPISDKELLKLIRDSEYVGILYGENSKVGTVGKILEVSEVKEGANILLQGLTRFSKDYLSEDGEQYLKAHVTYKETVYDNMSEIEAIKPRILSLFNKINKVSPSIPRDVVSIINAIYDDTGMICDMIAASADTTLSERQEILEEVNLSSRMRVLLKLLNKKLNVLEIGAKIDKETRNSIEKTNKEYFLKRQRDEIDKQLGEKESKSEVEEYKKKVEDKNLPEEALEEANRELRRMERMHPASHEYSIVATYLDWIIDLPWNDSTEDNINISDVRKSLDADHYGLKRPKKRILEFLAVRQMKAASRTPILCFVSPPGTGKTSLGKSIANAIGRKFYRMSLGGIRDEAEIRGFKRTYVGAMPGRIIQSIKRAGSNNPLVMLDEIDKLCADHRGDPSSALLEALDPEQNNTFNDHYINVPFDLSKVMFITTANTLDTIQPALRDRMEVIELHGYSQYEKIKIAKEFLIPKQLEEHGINSTQIKFTDESLDEIINAYTTEAGVRNLERGIADVCRGVITDIVEKGIETKRINRKTVFKYLGVPKYKTSSDIEITKYGLSTVLYASSLGGAIDLIETVKFPREGKTGKVTTSGSLGDVLEESVKVSLTWIKNNAENLNIDYIEGVSNNDIHIHFPSGGTKKDGPSAGIALVTALISLLTETKMKSNIAMTGEMTLRGRVLEVGGVKHKVLAAHKVGIKEIILPKWNEKDLSEDLPPDVIKDIRFHFVDSVDEVLELVF